jgi:molybdenum cofactor cytidylyltransferase
MNAFVPALDPSIAFALLAAGGATRFGGGKLDAMLCAKPLWRWAADTAETAGFATRVLIVGGHSRLEAPVPAGWSVVSNPNAQSGIASSIRAACSAAAGCRRLVIGLGDMPLIERDHLRALALAEGVVFTRYSSDREGVPAGFSRNAFTKLAHLEGDHGAASLDWGPGRIAISPRSPDSLLDIDTPQDLDRARVQIMAR